MDVGSIAAALVAARMAQVQLAVAAKVAKMQADNGAAVVKLVSAADQNLNSLAGLGGNLDISA
jgi:hypothetical protein